MSARRTEARLRTRNCSKRRSVTTYPLREKSHAFPNKSNDTHSKTDSDGYSCYNTNAKVTDRRYNPP
jgi:hypothetical protein